jgi:hypothetical protein
MIITFSLANSKYDILSSLTNHLDTDSSYTDDIGSPGTTDIKTLQMMCASRPYCAGFNSNGVLKYSVANQEFVNGTTLYVRDPLPPPYDPAPFNVWPQPAEWSTLHTDEIVLEILTRSFELPYVWEVNG